MKLNPLTREPLEAFLPHCTIRLVELKVPLNRCEEIMDTTLPRDDRSALRAIFDDVDLAATLSPMTHFRWSQSGAAGKLKRKFVYSYLTFATALTRWTLLTGSSIKSINIKTSRQCHRDRTKCFLLLFKIYR